ncbi:Eukaryotic translation initiation factor 3 subunit A, putative [Theobroma cacao]|uniref:Eukaryotic translation initiation factor 3 subunit A, putative n=1 Tax=Theobroma cacao TaxID=3641 RepID=A0A061E5D4_THECC|nr:Eukaryotic translation initiation factor 3 subunit A, putative [Theobroma cacao]
MAAQTFHHTRSNSFPLPSRLSPLVSQIDEHLNRLKASNATSTSSAISHKLNGLQDLYDSVDKLLQLPFSQLALVQEQHKEWVNELLDGSLRLLDLCSTAKDVVLQTKENAHEIQSVLRRRRSGELELVGEVKRYFISRKVLQKTIHKALRNLNGLETNRVFSSSDDHETTAMVSLLREVEQVTSSTLEYLLSMISGPKEQSKPGSWLVSKLLHHKRTACEQAGRDINEFEKVDASLRLLVNQKMSRSENIINIEMQNQLKDLELCTQDFEDGLECLFRCMIKARVFLLNTLNP